ncbi:MAG: flagellar basal body P-ring protein FlgI [Planctomycetota bacterium]|nr:flagellar basal body P-ring protein FlgI [Planctomycetota bacterium]
MAKRFAGLLFAVFAVCALFGRARAEAIRELVTIHGRVPVTVKGFGLVTGLAKTGDKSKAAQMELQKYLGENNMAYDRDELATGNVALVAVTAEIPASFRPGQRFPVVVTSINDATDLEGGELYECHLILDGELYATASGQIAVGQGKKTRGVIPAGDNSGGMQVGAYPYGQVVSKDGMVRLNLNRPNYADATAIARQINQTPSLNPFFQETVMFAEAAPFRPVAFVKDDGQVVVQIPDQHRYNVPGYIHQILEVPVAVDRPARIVVNRTRNSIVITGDVQVGNAVVSLQDKTVTIRPETEEDPAAYVLGNDTPRRLVEVQGPGAYADLQSLIDTLNAMGLTTDQIITIFEELRTAGAIRAEFVGM